MARPRSPLLSRERIVAAAIALVDAEGLAALSTRRLATQLGVSGPSLYNHFATKDDLLEAVADAVYGALVDAGWPPREATRIGALMRFFVVGAATGSFAAGFVDDPELYGADYPHLSDAHRLQARRREIDEAAFETGLDALIAGLEPRFAGLPTVRPA